MYLLSLLRGCCHVVEIGRVPSINIIRGASTMTTADGAVRVFYLEPKILFAGGIFSFRIHSAQQKKSMFSIFHLFPTESPTSEKNRSRQSSVIFQDVLLLHQK